jgi:hypothetical protein
MAGNGRQLRSGDAPGSFAHFFGAGASREPNTSRGIEVREVVRVVNTKEFGDINVSTLLSLLTLVGLAFLTTL